MLGFQRPAGGLTTHTRIHIIESMNANREYLTVRNVSPELSRALEAERIRRGESLNQTVLDLLKQSLGVGSKRTNGLKGLAGTWSREQLEEFEANVEPFSVPDEEMWR